VSVSRRTFVSRCTATLGAFSLRPALSAWAEPQGAAPAARPPRPPVAEYDKLVKLSANENPYGPSEAVMKAMTDGLKYAHRYAAPDGGLVEAIAAHHGVKPENVLVGAGSGEILDVVGTTYLEGGRRVLGFDPTYNSVYQHATTVKSEGIKLPLRDDSTQDVGALVAAARTHYRDIGFVYLCNPNNPTGIVVRKDEVKQLLDGLPADVPVLIDEAYHHFVTDPGYATAIPYVLEGRQVVVSRTFSKIAGLAGMRLGYAIAPKEMIEHMRPHAIGSINTAVRWAGVAALADTETQTRVRTQNAEARKSTAAALETLGYHVLPSETNFFMVDIRREVVPVIEAFRARGIAVGRPFPPMTKHLRVSIGTASEMAQFLDCFADLMRSPKTATGDPHA
jgi:histidinol-phosphate aminotransferase